MEDEHQEAKRARTIRFEYNRDVESVQAWIQAAEAKVQDKSVEPHKLKEFLQEIHCEIGSVTDQLERLTRHGHMICQRTSNQGERELVANTITSLNEQLQQVKNWLEDKKAQVGDSLESWQLFIQLYNSLRNWVERQRNFLSDPLKFATLPEARGKLQEYAVAVKDCKWANKQAAEMTAELAKIGQCSDVGPLTDKQAEMEQERAEVESNLKEVMALLQEMAEEWEQCERKSKDVAGWIEKTRQSLDNPQNKKRSLRDQLANREKVLADVSIQKTKLVMAMEKLQVHFRDRMCAEAQVSHENEQLQRRLDELQVAVKEDCRTLEACVHQMDAYQQEIQRLRQQMVGVEQQLRIVSSPTYSPRDRDKAVAEQNVHQGQCESHERLIAQLTERIYQIDPCAVIPTEITLETTETSTLASTLDTVSGEVMKDSPLLPNADSEVQVMITRELPASDADGLDLEVNTLTDPNMRSMHQHTTTMLPTSDAGIQLTWADIAAGRKSPGLFGQACFEEINMPQVVSKQQEVIETEPETEPSLETASFSTTPAFSGELAPEESIIMETTTDTTSHVDPITSTAQAAGSAHRDEKPLCDHKNQQQQFSKNQKSPISEQDGKTHKRTQPRDRRYRKKQQEQQPEPSSSSDAQEEVYYDAPSRRNSQKISPKRACYTKPRPSPRESPKDTPMVTPKTSPTESPKLSPQAERRDNSRVIKPEYQEPPQSTSEEVRHPRGPLAHVTWDGRKTYAEILKGSQEMRACREKHTNIEAPPPPLPQYISDEMDQQPTYVEVSTQATELLEETSAITVADPVPPLVESSESFEAHQQEYEMFDVSPAVEEALPTLPPTLQPVTQHIQEEAPVVIPPYTAYLEQNNFVPENVDITQTNEQGYQQSMSMPMFHHGHPVENQGMQAPVHTLETPIQNLVMGGTIDTMSLYARVIQYPTTNSFIPEGFATYSHSGEFPQPSEDNSEFTMVSSEQHQQHPTDDTSIMSMVPTQPQVTPPMMTPPETPDQYPEEEEEEEKENVASEEPMEVTPFVFEQSYTDSSEAPTEMVPEPRTHTDKELHAAPSMESIDKPKLSYAQILAMGLKAAPSAVVSHTYGALRSVMSYVKGPVAQDERPKPEPREKPVEVRPKEKPSESLPRPPIRQEKPTIHVLTDQERSRGKKRSLEPKIEVTLAKEPEEPRKEKDPLQAETYIPGLVFKAAVPDRRSRSKSARRKKREGSQHTEELPKDMEMPQAEAGKKESTRKTEKQPKVKVPKLEHSMIPPLKEVKVHSKVSEAPTPSCFQKTQIQKAAAPLLVEDKASDKPKQSYQPKASQAEPKDKKGEKIETEKVLVTMIPEGSKTETSKAPEVEEKRKKKKKRVVTNPEEHEDELEKALREIEEMERSGKLQPPVAAKPPAGEEDKTKRRGFKRTRKTERPPTPKPMAQPSQGSDTSPENVEAATKPHKMEKKKAPKNKPTETEKTPTEIKGTKKPSVQKRDTCEATSDSISQTGHTQVDEHKETTVEVKSKTPAEPVVVSVPEQVAVPSNQFLDMSALPTKPIVPLCLAKPVTPETAAVPAVDSSLSCPKETFDVGALEDVARDEVITPKVSLDTLAAHSGSLIEANKATVSICDKENKPSSLHDETPTLEPLTAAGKVFIEKDFIEKISELQPIKPKERNTVLNKEGVEENIHETDEIRTSKTKVYKVIRRRVIKKIVIIDGKPVETEEVIEEPEEVTEEMLQNLPADSVITETVTEPEVTTVHRIIRRRVIKKIVIIDGKPVETEEVIEEPEEVTEEMLLKYPETYGSVEFAKTNEPETVDIKSQVIIDDKPDENEEVVKIPVNENSQSNLLLETSMGDFPSSSETTDTKELTIDHFPQPAKDSLTGLKDGDKLGFSQEDLYPQEVCLEEQPSQHPEDHTAAPYVPEEAVEPCLLEELVSSLKPEEKFPLPVSSSDQLEEVSPVHVAFEETVYQPSAEPSSIDKPVIEPFPSPPLPVYKEKEPSKLSAFIPEPKLGEEERKEDKDVEILHTQPSDSEVEIARPLPLADPHPVDPQPLVSVPKDVQSSVLPPEDMQANVIHKSPCVVSEDTEQDAEVPVTTTVTECKEERLEPILDIKTPEYEKDVSISEHRKEEAVSTLTIPTAVTVPVYEESTDVMPSVTTPSDPEEGYESVAVILGHEVKKNDQIDPVSDIPKHEISEDIVVDKCEIVKEKLILQKDETDIKVPDEDSVKKHTEEDEKEMQAPKKENVHIESSVPVVLQDPEDKKLTESEDTVEVSHEGEEYMLLKSKEKESEIEVFSKEKETPRPAELMEDKVQQKVDILTSPEIAEEVNQELMGTDTGMQSSESSDSEEKEPDISTDQKDGAFITVSESNLLPDEELTQQSDDLQSTTDKLIDEHTAGPPEIKPQISLPTSSLVEKLDGDQEAGEDVQPIVPGDEESSRDQLLVEELIISEEWQTIYTLLKRRQNLREVPQSTLPSTALMLAPSSLPSRDQQEQQIDENLEKLKSALDKKEVIVVQKVIISIVETVTTWLETIEYRIYTIKNTDDSSERNRQYEYLQTELNIIEEKLVILEKVTKSAVEILSEETIITIIETVKCLRHQVKQVEKVRKGQQENLEEEEKRYTQFMDAVANTGEEVSKLKAQLCQLQDSKMSPEEKLSKLELLLITNEDTRDCITQLLLNSHDLKLTPSQHIGDELASIQEELCDFHDSVEKELDQVLRLTTSTTEYEETLMELTHLIEMAETILEARVVARDHSSLVDTITKHRKLFVSLRQCQKVLESLDTALEPNSRVHYQELYSRSYLKASKLLDKATQRNHQLSLLEAEWLRLLNQLKEEEVWIMSASEQVTQLHTLASDTYQENTNSCKDCQDLLVESVTHEAHMGHLVEMVRKVGDSVTCTHLETRVSSHHQRNTSLRQEVSRLLERLEEMHVHWAAYQTQMDQLQEWCSQTKASLENIDLTPQDQQKLKEQFNQIWNLRAQFDSQTVLLNECMDHFDKSVGLVNMTDETNQRHFLSKFRTEWNELEELLHEKEKELHKIQIQVVPVPQLLTETRDTLTYVEDALQNIDTNITSVQQLRDIQENYKVLRIKIMNSKGNLDYLTQVSSEDEEQDQDIMDNLGKLSLTCQELICTIQQRIASLEYTLDNVQKTVSRVERISLTMKHLKSTLERCQAIDKEGEQILKAAFHSCQTIHGSVSRTEGDITKVKQNMESLSQDPHHPCQLTELSAQIDSLEEELQSLSECIKETRENLKNRLEIWQKFMSTSDAVDGFLQEVEYLLESAVDLPSSVNMDALRKHVEDLQGLQESMTTNETLLEMLKCRAVQVEKNHSVETQLVRWNNVSQKLESVILRYETALELWNHFITVEEEVRVWVESKITMVVSLQSRGITHEHCAQIQVLVGEAAWSGERVSELRQLAHQIRLHLAEDTAQDTPLVAEVERLGFRITNLTEAITQLSSNLTQQVNAEQHQKQENALQELEAGINGAHTLLALPEPEVNEAAERATQLKDQLVALGGTGGPVIETGPSQVVEAWQVAVRDTHSRYQQVVAGLGGDEEQLAAALTTWKQYVESVEASMSAPAPASREGLHEASRLCQVHRSILNTQTNVLLTLQEQAQQENAPPRIRDLQGRLRELILRHKTVLTTVSEREQLLLQTITTWETYRVKIAQLQTWILALEQEKQGLQLRQVARRRLDKVISRLQSLQEQLGRGEEQVEEIEKLCQILVASCDSSIHPILKAELASLQQRVTNMRAGVETWLGYLNKSSALWQRYEDVYSKLHTILAEIQAGLSADMPSDFCSVQETIKKYNETTAALEALSGDLSLLRTTREEMVDSLTPADLRLVTQRMWRVTQLQAELLHQYRLKISTLEDRLELWELYDTRYQQFLTWAKDMEAKIDGGSEQYIDSLIRKLEHDYQEDINAKSVEMHWLLSEGEELISCSKKDQAAQLKEKVEIIETTWKHIHDKCNSRKQKLQDIVTTINKAEVTLAELKEWLFLIEKKLSSPVIFQNSSKKEIDRLLEAEEEIRKEIEKQSGTISSVLNLCDMVIHDCNEFDANGDTDSLQEAHHNLDRRWGEICTRSAERKAFIKKTWKMWQELVSVNNSFSAWLTNMESRLRDLDVASYHIPYSGLEEIVATVHQLQPLIHNQTPQYESLNQHYRVLARPYGRENRLDQENEIRTLVKTSNARFHTLSYQITVILRRISFSRTLFERYEASRERLMIWLNDFDLKITEYEQYPHGNLEHKKRALLGLVADYERHEKEQKEFEDLITYLYQRSCYSDCTIIEESLTEYWVCRKLIRTRLLALQKDVEIEITQITTEERLLQDQEDDYRVPLVSDTELQNLEPTLSPTDMSLIGAVGGRSMVVEMRVALDESKKIILQLEEALKCPTPQGAEVDKMYYSFSKQLAGCRSSVDLLSSLKQHTGDDAEARQLHPEIDAVIEDFTQLEAQAQAKQLRLKENSETSSLTCPLCCRRNWQQFENDMWRLEQWLAHAEATQSTQHNPPVPMEQLEEVAQDHREFLMDLDGHKSVIMSLNIIGKHLADHTRDERRATRVRDRLAATNRRWEAVCAAASVWQAKLQTTLMGNSEFHSTIADLLAWTETTEESLIKIAAEEDMEETALRDRVARVLDVRAEVERCEPRVASLHEAAQHLLPTQQDDKSAAVREQLAILSQRLQLLLQMCSKQLVLLSQILGQDFTSSLASLASSGLYESAEFTFSRPTSPSSLSASFHSDAHDVLGIEGGNEGVVRRSYRFLGRVMRAALPIQALMLLMLGVASLVPTSEDDYACSMVNNFARSLDPMLRYPNGPPPF